MSNILPQLISGLGLFFLGLHLVGTNLKQISSRQFRSLIARFTDRVWRGSLLGVLAGAVLQSTSAVTVILASMATTGLITIRQALPLVAWSNVGTTLLVFATIFDLRLVVLYLLGISALAFVFSGEVGWRSLVGIILGISLLFFGIDSMKASAGNVKEFEWFQELMAQAHRFYLIAFAAGAMLSFLTNSTTAVAMIAVTLANSGVLGPHETLMVVYGGNVGSTFSRSLLSGGMRGSSRQIGRFQDLFKISGSALFVALFYLEEYTGVPLVLALVSKLSGRVESQAALANFLCNLVPAMALTPLIGPIHRLLERFWPPTEAEDFAKLKFLHPEALDDPETAIDLVEKEQTRLVTHLPGYLDAIRTQEQGKRRPDVRRLHQSFLALFGEVESYLTALVRTHLAASGSERLTNVHNRHGAMGLLEDGVYQLVLSVAETPPSPSLAPLVSNVTEALEFLLLTVGDAVTSLDATEADLTAGLCADRGEMLGRIRNLYLTSEAALSPVDKSLLLEVTTRFDRIVWMVRRLAELLQQNQRFRP
jgi:phosphate:Na+ symporter